MKRRQGGGRQNESSKKKQAVVATINGNNRSVVTTATSPPLGTQLPIDAALVPSLHRQIMHVCESNLWSRPPPTVSTPYESNTQSLSLAANRGISSASSHNIASSFLSSLAYSYAVPETVVRPTNLASHLEPGPAAMNLQQQLYLQRQIYLQRVAISNRSVAFRTNASDNFLSSNVEQQLSMNRHCFPLLNNIGISSMYDPNSCPITAPLSSSYTLASNVLANALQIVHRSALEDNHRLLNTHVVISTRSADDVLPVSTNSSVLVLPSCVYTPIDSYLLTPHQCLLRKQIEYFEATTDDVMVPVRGRNKPVTIKQVGIRCKHCAHVPTSLRQKGSTYFPSNKLGIYQAAQNMSTTHLQCGLCTFTPDEIKNEFAIIMADRQRNDNGAGRPYWSKSATQSGLVDTEEHGIRFMHTSMPSGSRFTEAEMQLLEH